MNNFLTSYINAALWSSLDDDGNPLDATYELYDISAECVADMFEDCKAFIYGNAEVFEFLEALPKHDLERAGIDFWLTRNGHGAGFWDGDWPAPWDGRLTDWAKTFGNVDLYVGDDELIHSN